MFNLERCKFPLVSSLTIIFNPMRLLFAFALYGSDAKYTTGMIDNCSLLSRAFPGCSIGIALGNDVPADTVSALEVMPGVFMRRLDFCGAAVMAERMFLFEESDCEVMFVRDADSRVHDRDQACIRAFLEEDTCLVHTIRDHVFHRQLIMGGLFGIKRAGLELLGGALRPRYALFLQTHNIASAYGTDEHFLSQVVYPLVCESLLVHSDLFEEEDDEVEQQEDEVFSFWESEKLQIVNPKWKPVPVPLSSEHDFCGNVIMGNGNPEFSMLDPAFLATFHSHFVQRKRICHNMIVHTFANDLLGYMTRILRAHSPSRRYQILWDILAAFYELDACRALPPAFFRLFELTHVDERIILFSNRYLRERFAKVIGSSSSSGNGSTEQPLEDSCNVRVVYCNVPHEVRNLPAFPVVYRHPVYCFSMTHDRFESHRCWDLVNRIHVINLEDRPDRFLETMVELGRVGAPLDRVVHYRARKDGDPLAAYRGATKNHIDVLRQETRAEYVNPQRPHTLILEDDITFTSLVDQMHADLTQALELLGTDYDMLFLAASKFHEIEDSAHEVVRVSKQECTTSSAYLVNSSSVPIVLETALQGYEGMVDEKGDLVPERVHTNCIDRYWARLNPRGRMYVFRCKMAYQRPSFSNLTGKVNVGNFD